MKHLISKRFLFLSLGLAILGGLLGVLAQEGLTIKTDEFSAVQKIRTTFFVEKVKDADYNKVKTAHGGGNVLQVVACEVRGDCEKQLPKNKVSISSSALGGRDNDNTAGASSSLIVGGVNNKITSSSVAGSFVGGSQDSTIGSVNSVVLGSQTTDLKGDNSVAVGVQNAKLNKKGGIAIGGKNIVIDGENSFAIGDEVNLSHQGVFGFNAKTETLTSAKDHTFLINADRGLVVNTEIPSANSEVLLTVGGAIKVGFEAKTPSKHGSIVTKTCKSGATSYTCVCAYGVETTVKSLSSHPVCQEVCKRNNGASCPPVSAACGDRAKNYSHAMTTWPVNTNYCATGEPKTRPGFPAQNESVTWECVGLSNSVPCTATRDAKPEPKKVCEGEIPVNSKPASDDEQEGLTANTQRTLVDSNTASVKCERVCISGYKLNAAKTACEPLNLCGGNSNNYPGSTSAYSATFCIAGATSSPTAPAFPKAGETVTWKCTLGTNTTECHASRANLEPGVCKNNGVVRHTVPAESERCANGSTFVAGSLNTVGTPDYVDHYQWKCKKDTETTCSAHRPLPGAGTCPSNPISEDKVGTCAEGDPTAVKNIAGGRQWECKGKDGGSVHVCVVCDPNYTADTNKIPAVCDPNTRTFTCNAAEKPREAEWNTVSSYTQTWSGDKNQYLPKESSPTYNLTPSTEECRYKCPTGFSWNESTKTCENYACQGSFENAKLIPGTDQGLTGNVTSRLVQSPTGGKCEWRCDDNYVKGEFNGKDVCLQCKAGTWNPTNRSCESVPLCSDGYVAYPDEDDGGKLKCFPLGNCLDKDGNPSNDKPYYYSFFLSDSRPIAKNLKWEYVTTPLEKNKCQYHCQEGAFYYNDRKRCEKTYCNWGNVDKNFAYFIDNVPSNQPYNNSISVKGEYLLPSDFQNKKNLNPQPLGCYYTCKEDKYKYFRNNAWQCWSEDKISDYQEAENKNCKKLPTGLDFGIETIERPTIKDQNRTYVSKITPSLDNGCYRTCKEGYIKGLSNGIEGCYTKCEVNKYRYDNSSIFGFCSSCPTGKIGDENSPKIFGNPTSCRDACADKPGTMWSPLGGGRGSCISTLPSDMQCPEGMDLVEVGGEYKCLSCIAPQTLNKDTGMCE